MVIITWWSYERIQQYFVAQQIFHSKSTKRIIQFSIFPATITRLPEKKIINWKRNAPDNYSSFQSFLSKAENDEPDQSFQQQAESNRKEAPEIAFILFDSDVR